MTSSIIIFSLNSTLRVTQNLTRDSIGNSSRIAQWHKTFSAMMNTSHLVKRIDWVSIWSGAKAKAEALNLAGRCCLSELLTHFDTWWLFAVTQCSCVKFRWKTANFLSFSFPLAIVKPFSAFNTIEFPTICFVSLHNFPMRWNNHRFEAMWM